MTGQPASSAPHLAVRPEWLALHEEAIIEPALPIVDPHHHLWDRPGSRYFLFDLLRDVNSGHNIRATVAVEAGAMYRRDAAAELRPLGETEFLNGAAAMSASGAEAYDKTTDLTWQRCSVVVQRREEGGGRREEGGGRMQEGGGSGLRWGSKETDPCTSKCRMAGWLANAERKWAEAAGGEELQEPGNRRGALSRHAL